MEELHIAVEITSEASNETGLLGYVDLPILKNFLFPHKRKYTVTDRNNMSNITNCPISTCKSLCDVYNASITTLED